jgi:hypothetical protein
MWIAENGCSQGSMNTAEYPGCVVYSDCSEGFPVMWCENDGGHVFDGTYADQAVALFRSL